MVRTRKIYKARRARKKMKQLKLPNLIPVPTFLQGTLAQLFSPGYDSISQGNLRFRFSSDDSSGTMRGSDALKLGLTNLVLAPIYRTIVPTDDIYETVLPLIKDKFYADLNALDVRKEKPSYKRNQEIWERAIELSEQIQGKPKFPFRIQGFYCVPDASQRGYELRIEPAPNFRVIEDERLNLPPGTKFNSLDENGMINPKRDGRFTWDSGKDDVWSVLNDGVSRVYLESGGTLGESDIIHLSSPYGRVVVVYTEGIVSKSLAEKN